MVISVDVSALELRRFIKYNHLVANCIIFYNVNTRTRILRQLVEEGVEGDGLYGIEPGFYSSLKNSPGGIYELKPPPVKIPISISKLPSSDEYSFPGIQFFRSSDL